MMKLIIIFVMLGILSWVMPVPLAMAANNCSITQGKALNISINIPTLRPASKGTVGTVLGRGEVNTSSISYTCGNLIRNTWRSSFTRPESTLQAMTNVYNTNIPGLGIRLSWPASRSMFFPNAAECISACTEPADKVVLEFVQTGTISSGTIPAGVIGKVSLVADSNPGTPLDIVTINLSAPVDVAPKSCAILTTAQNVELGTYSLADFQNRVVRRGAEVPFTLVLSCPQQASVQFQFRGEHPVGTTKGYIANCDESSCAKNVGVRLLNNSGTAIDTTGVSVDATGKSGASTIITGDKTFGYKAQIYPIDTATMTAGKIDTYVVFDIFMN
ncbi:fimbrial protein [Rahnella aceris]|uniref:fimbrial protein n=1 Tax=Rahnella sp. (strain Y9602) TaxID=2703885 RepID=UPI001C25A716|nr:fimbrial protein [Rahnella aceris]MBU9851584.1 type 1 fimbrial protein [Rahnella aceris]